MNHKQHLIALLVVGASLWGCSGSEERPTERASTRHSEGIVKLSPKELSHATLQFETAELGNVGLTLRTTGRVVANANKTARVSTVLEGRLTQINVDLNDRVKKGMLLATVETPELVGRPLEIRSPIDGIVLNRNRTLGELVDKSAEILTVTDPSELWVIAEIKERDIGSVKIGQDVSFQVLPYPERKFHGEVVLMGNQVESDSRTVEARIRVDNADGALKPGMFADVSIVTTVVEHVLTVADSALQTDEDKEILFVALDAQSFEKRVVSLGVEQEGRVQITAGLKPGERVVTTGSFVLKSELLKDELGEE